MDHSIDPAINELKAIASMPRNRLVRESCAVKRAVEPIAAAVSCKNAPGAIAAVRRRREANYKQPRLRVAKARHGTTPVLLVSETTDFFTGHALSPFDKSRTAKTINDLFLDSFETLAFRHSQSKRLLTLKLSKAYHADFDA